MDIPRHEAEDDDLLPSYTVAGFASDQLQNPCSTFSHLGHVIDDDFRLEPFNVPVKTELAKSNAQEFGKSWKPSEFVLRRRSHLVKCPRTRTCFNGMKNWTWELAAFCGSLFTFVALVGLLKKYDGRAQPHWPYNITINALVSWLATAIRALLCTALTACISQGAWTYFRSGPHALGDLTIYDSASRGPLGAVRSLWKLQAKPLRGLGAILTILVLAIDPTLQQIISIQSEAITSATIATVPQINVLSSMRGIGKGGPVLHYDLFGAGYAGFFSGTNDSNSSSLDVVPSCPTGNCTYPQFQSLALCSSCQDVTDALTTACSSNVADDGQSESCHFSLSNGLEFNTVYPYRGSMASNGSFDPIGPLEYANAVLNFSIIKLKMSNESTAGAIIETRSSNGSATSKMAAIATQCFLYWCVNTYDTKVKNGEVIEEARSFWHGKSENLTVNDGKPLYFTIDGPSPRNTKLARKQYLVDWLVHYEVANWLTREFSVADGALVEPTKSGSPRLTAPSNPCEHPVMSEAIINQFRQYDASILFSNLARAFTNKLRSLPATGPNYDGENLPPDDGPANGTAFFTQVIVRVRWGWLAFSASLILLTMLFLVLTIVTTATSEVPAWKASPYPLIFHNLEQSNVDRLQAARETGQMEKVVRSITVQLKRSDDGCRLETSGDAIPEK